MSIRFLGGIITNNATQPTLSSAKGVWTLSQQSQAKYANAWPLAAIPDPQFNYVTALLNGNGINGAQNNTFVDSSTNNFTITRNGNTTQGSFSPYGPNWSNYFDGTGDYLSLVGINLGSSDFTIEGWIYPTNSAAGATQVIYCSTGGGSSSRITLQLSTGMVLQSYIRNSDGTNIVTYSGSGAIPINTWSHVAVVRNSENIYLYVNGILNNTPASSTQNISTNVTATYIGSVSASAQMFFGNISNLRVNTTAVYTANFTPPTAPLTAIAGTSLLTCADNRFIDDSANNFAITVNGNTSIERFSPFGTATSYSTSVIGGSGYFDGTGDYLQIPQNNANVITGSGTVEAWIYLTSYNTTDAYATSSIVYNSNGGTASTIAWTGFGVYGNYLQGALTFKNYVNNEEVTSASGLIKLNTWYHVAAVRSSNVMNLYVNGVSVASGAMTGNLFNNNSGWYFQIGHWQYSTNNNRYFKGYMTDLRIVNGTAVYTSAFTPPTAPLTAITNTSLLLSYTDAGIYDSAMMNNLETVGNAQVSTSVVKYGTGSMYFDGTGDRLLSPLSPVNIIGGGDFTIEFWLYPSNTSSAYRALVSSENYPTTTGGWSLYQNGTAVEFWMNGSASAIINATSALTAGTWQHLALCRASGTLRLFKDGTSISSVAHSTSMTGQQIWIADNNSNGGGLYYFNGFMDDLRITKGYARYTANFTPPTAAFPTLGPV